jgi:hypothetical protein
VRGGFPGALAVRPGIAVAAAGHFVPAARAADTITPADLARAK